MPEQRFLRNLLIASLIAPLFSFPAVFSVGFIEYLIFQPPTGLWNHLEAYLGFSFYVVIIVYPIVLIPVNILAFLVSNYSEFTYKKAFLIGLFVSVACAIPNMEIDIWFSRSVFVGTLIVLVYWWVWSKLNQKIGD